MMTAGQAAYQQPEGNASLPAVSAALLLLIPLARANA
jgi:hypothetical protein